MQVDCGYAPALTGKEIQMNTSHTPLSVPKVVVVMLLLGFSLTAIGSGNFATVSLPKGVSIELPKNWVVLSNNQLVTLDTSVESRLDLSGVQQQASLLPFAANCLDDRGNTIGILNIRYYPQLDVTQADAQSFTEQDLIELDNTLRDNATKEMKIFGMSLVAWKGTIKENINGIIAFITEYYRASANKPGEFRVRLIRVFAGDRSFTLTVSYLQTAADILQPTTDRIIGSLRLSGLPSPPIKSTPTAMKPTTSAVISQRYDEQWPLALCVSFIITWLVGMAPPLLIRYAFVRGPIAKGRAIAVVAVFWALNVVLFSALGSDSKYHGALALVALVSYKVLRIGAKNSPTTTRVKEFRMR